MGRLRVYMFHHVSCVFFSPWYPLIINRCLGFAASRRWKWPGQLLTLPTGPNTWKRQIGCWDLNPPFGSIWEWSERITYILRAWWQTTRLASRDWMKRTTHSWLDVEGIRVLSLFQEFRIFNPYALLHLRCVMFFLYGRVPKKPPAGTEECGQPQVQMWCGTALSFFRIDATCPLPPAPRLKWLQCTRSPGWWEDAALSQPQNVLWQQCPPKMPFQKTGAWWNLKGQGEHWHRLPSL